jgi:polyadenylation factor subunit 2
MMMQDDDKKGDRKIIEPHPALVSYIHSRPYLNSYNRPLPTFAESMPQSAICRNLVCSFKNKKPSPVFSVQWTNHGKRVIIGCDSGEFLLWSGITFKYESLIQGHNSGIRAMKWTRNYQFMISGDSKGNIIVSKNNMKNLKQVHGHDESVRDLAFSPGDGIKFVSCSDDKLAKIWDFSNMSIERELSGHGWDVKCADWHPYKSLIATGSKDSLVKLWDPKSSRELCNVHAHNNAVTKVKWSINGNFLLTGSKDTLIKLYDLRTMTEFQVFKRHQKEVSSLAWHPFHEELFVSGGFDGSLGFWITGYDDAAEFIMNAHAGVIRDVAWHPLGHLLATGSKDSSTRFWSRVNVVN